MVIQWRSLRRALRTAGTALISAVACAAMVWTGHAVAADDGARVDGSGTAIGECQRDAAPGSRSAAWWNGAARLLAGTDEQGQWPMFDRKSAATHRDQMNTVWAKFDAKRLQPIREFSLRELNVSSGAAPVFYPFSGPDAAYALAFFPQSADFIFTGLEPVGEVPDLAALDDAVLTANLNQLRDSLRSILALSFFVTMEMDSDLRRNKLSGVTPILMLFLARHGYTVTAVEPFVMNADGRLCRTDARQVKDVRSTDIRIPGVIVRYQAPGDTDERRIVYLQADLSNEGLQRRPHYLRFVESVNPPTTLIKSASYLLHLREFTTMRDHILKHAKVVLQDDTGVPLKLYKVAQWEQRLYGTYVGPIPIFRTRYQPEMMTAYRDAAQPLGFGIGYRYESHESNLQLFVRRTAKQTASLSDEALLR